MNSNNCTIRSINAMIILGKLEKLRITQNDEQTNNIYIVRKFNGTA